MLFKWLMTSFYVAIVGSGILKYLTTVKRQSGVFYQIVEAVTAFACLAALVIIPILIWG